MKNYEKLPLSVFFVLLLTMSLLSFENFLKLVTIINLLRSDREIILNVYE